MNQRQRLWAPLVALALCFLAPQVASAQLIDLGTLGGASSQAFGIRPDGSQVVGTAQNGSAQNQAFVWSAGTGMTGLGFLSGGASAQARAINAAGTIAGWSSDGTADQAVLWTSASPTLIPNTLGGSGARAFGISAPGASERVVGWARDGAAQRAFVYTTATATMTALDLTALNPQHAGLSARAFGISPNGRFVVGEYEVDNGTIETRGFVYDLTAPVNSYEFSGGGPGSATAASNSFAVGVILAGGTDNVASFSNLSTGASDFLPALYGSAGSASAISASGLTVGTTADIALGNRATLWSAASTGAVVRDLNSLHNTSAVLRQANGISDSPGAFSVVGTGDFGGNSRAYLLMVPEPSSALLLLASLPCAVLVRRRIPPTKG